MAARADPVVLFDAETNIPGVSCRNFLETLKNEWQAKSLKGDVTELALQGVSTYIGVIWEKEFTADQVQACQAFLRQGGNIFILANGDRANSRSVNALLEPCGIKLNNDAVIRTQFLKYFHPAEALIEDGIASSAVATAPGLEIKDEDYAKAPKFLYPHGSSLKLKKGLAVPLLTSGSLCYPLNQPLAALYRSKASKGRMLVLGSTAIFSDAYLDKEDNKQLLKSLLACIVESDERFQSFRYSDNEYTEYQMTPDLVTLSAQIKSCIQETETQTPVKDPEQIFDSTLFSIDYKLWPDTIRAYEQLGIEHAPLMLIEPTFEQALPTLKPSTYPALFRHPSLPRLELVNLDREFSSEREKLVELAIQHRHLAEPDKFILACANILDITRRLPGNQQTAKHALHFICKQVAQFKTVNQEGGVDYGMI